MHDNPDRQGIGGKKGKQRGVKEKDQMLILSRQLDSRVSVQSGAVVSLKAKINIQ